MRKTPNPISLNLTSLKGDIKEEILKHGYNDKWFLNGYEDHFYDLPEKFDPDSMIYLAPNGKEVLGTLGKLVIRNLSF